MNLFAMADPRPIHFMGIAGAGMSGLALLARQQGVAVTGCDTDPSGAADLAALGVEIWRGHDPQHVAGARAGVVTAAVAGQHPELERARAQGVPVVRRAEAPGQAGAGGAGGAVGGAHGEAGPPGVGTEGRAGRARQVIVGGDDVGAQRVAASLGVPVWRVGFGEDADVRILGVTLGAEGSEARVRLPDGAEVSLRLRVPGIHNVRNASMALAV